MISDSTSAQVIAQAAEHFLSKLSHEFELARSTIALDEFEQLKRAVGSVVGTLEIDLLRPIYRRHPSLEPDFLNDGEARSCVLTGNPMRMLSSPLGFDVTQNMAAQSVINLVQNVTAVRPQSHT